MSDHNTGRFRAADPNGGGRATIVLDTQGARRWPGRWHGREYRIDLIRDGKGGWFSAWLPFDAAGFDAWGHYCAPRGKRHAFQELSVPGALLLCGREGIPEPPELIADYEKPSPPQTEAAPARIPAGDQVVAATDEDEDSETKVARYLLSNPMATRKVVSAATGVPDGSIGKLDAWKVNRERIRASKSPEETDAMPRARSLTKSMLAVIASKSYDRDEATEEEVDAETLTARFQCDPAYRGAAQRDYLKSLTSRSDQAMYRDSDLDTQIQALVAWKLTGST